MLILAVALFFIATQYRLPSSRMNPSQPIDKIVISAPVQILMYAGDRFLAANLELMRVMAVGPTEEHFLASYRNRSHELVAQLNPCNEDNVYLSNAMLSWGGSVDEGNSILQRAMQCRFWDDIPPFFLGFNRYFFYRDFDGASKILDIAAERSTTNKAALKRMSIVMASRQLNDVKMAAAYLQNQRDSTTDPKLVEMLDRRLKRLEGLIMLRDAQARFEAEQGHPLVDPNELLTTGTLAAPPLDPMRIGYEFVDGQFQLRAMRIGGMEIR